MGFSQRGLNAVGQKWAWLGELCDLCHHQYYLTWWWRFWLVRIQPTRVHRKRGPSRAGVVRTYRDFPGQRNFHTSREFISGPLSTQNPLKCGRLCALGTLIVPILHVIPSFVGHPNTVRYNIKK